MDVLDDAGLEPTTKVVEVADDRCDACGARAYVYTIVNGTELAWCGHHGTQFWPKLTTEATVIVDLRHQLGHDE